MATKSIAWNTGSGNINVEYGGSKDGTIVVTSDNNNLYESRSQQIKVKTADGSNIERTITIQQAAKVRIDISSATVTAANQTYSGSAKTPTPTVTLNGETIPSSGYDVAYSNNTNAGTATITIAGKGDYTGTATGSFTIAKANRTLSFADSYVVLNTSSNVTKTATPSAGSGDGAITYSISSTTYATINSSSGKVTSKTSDGSAVVTATIAEGTNYLSATASYNLYVFATTHNYDYNGSYRSVTLPPGTYQFQCWGAQGGSNGTNSTYGITAKAGGKGGYSVGQLTISQPTGVRVYVGGQGSASAEGFNGGGSTTGTSQYNASNEFGYSKMGGGGGATDIRLSDGALLSRMIVAGGGGGGAMCLKRTTTTQNVWQQVGTLTFNGTDYCDGSINGTPILNYWCRYDGTYYTSEVFLDGIPFNAGDVIRVTASPSCNFNGSGQGRIGVTNYYRWGIGWVDSQPFIDQQTYTIPNDGVYFRVIISKGDVLYSGTLTFEIQTTEPVTSDSYSSQVGYVGGGSTGGGFSNDYKGKQNGAGLGGTFGAGASQEVSNKRYCSGAGGGGWYGGGCDWSETYMNTMKASGGGSGFVNTSANASYRPSGYTGLQLDSGETKAGNTSFPNTAGTGNETGHSGNGYAKITRLS